MMQPQFFCDTFYGERRIRIDPSKTGFARFPDAFLQCIGVIELRQESIKEAARLHSTRTSGFSMICFISNTEIIGSKRMKIKNSITNSAIVPRNVEMSQIVG